VEAAPLIGLHPTIVANYPMQVEQLNAMFLDPASRAKAINTLADRYSRAYT
jgi:hypothetical protein